MAPQFAKELFEVGQGDALATAYTRQRDRTGMLAQRQINHGGHRKTPFGGQSHRCPNVLAERSETEN
jgi:hypothetical protein